MEFKAYKFNSLEINILLNAMVEYQHFIKPGDGYSENRKNNHKIAMALKEQFKNDLRLI